MRGILLLPALLICVGPALSQTPSPKPVSAFDRQLIDQEKQFLQLTLSKDTAAVAHAVAEDFQGIETNGDLYDRDDLLESAEKPPSNARAYDFRVVKLDKQSAIVTYNLIVPEEHPRYRHMADTWVKIDGHWRLKFRQVTPNIWSADDTD